MLDEWGKVSSSCIHRKHDCWNKRPLFMKKLYNTYECYYSAEAAYFLLPHTNIKCASIHKNEVKTCQH